MTSSLRGLRPRSELVMLLISEVGSETAFTIRLVVSGSFAAVALHVKCH